MRILFLSVLACLALHFPGHSQSLKQVLEAGDESFQNRDYYNAYRCYETILKYADEGAYKGNTLKVKFSYAQAAQRLNYFSRAKALYGEVSREARGVDGDIYARSVFNQAKMYQNLAQDTTRYYGLALDTYQLFLSDELYQKIEGGPEIQSRFRRAAESGIQSCDAMRAALPSRTDSLYRLTGAVNSGYSELAPVLMGDTLVTLYEPCDLIGCARGVRPRVLKSRRFKHAFSSNTFIQDFSVIFVEVANLSRFVADVSAS